MGIALIGAMISPSVLIFASALVITIAITRIMAMGIEHRRSMLLNTVLLLTAISMTLLMMEVALRAYFGLFHRDIRAYQPSFVRGGAQFDRRRFVEHPFLPYAPKGGDARQMTVYRPAIGAYVTSDYAQNSFGFRTAERPFQKGPMVKRLITLGGSTTWDGPDNETTWPALLEKKLNLYYKREGGPRIEVINLAVDGAPSAVSLVNLSLLGLQYHPDLVISYDGVNDFELSFFRGVLPDYRNAIKRFDPSIKSLQLSLPSWAFRSYLVTLFSFGYDSARDLHVYGQMFKPLTGLTVTKSPLASIGLYERNLKLMRGVSAEYGARFIASIPHWATLNRELISYDEHLRHFLQQENIEYLDLENRLPHDDFSLHVDQFHWTAKGLNAVAEEWLHRIVDDDLLGLGK